MFNKFAFSFLSLILLNLIHPVYLLIPPGKDNPFYPIESYYGSRDQEYYCRGSILEDQPTTFQWTTNFDVDTSKGLLYIASRTKHTVQYRDLATDDLTIVAGIEDYSGFRDGNLDNTLFNGPVALKIFRYDKVKAQRERRKVMVVLKDDSVPCQYITYTNYSNCMDNQTNATIIPPSRIKEVYPPYDVSLVTHQDLELEAMSGKIIFVNDKFNHCIRKLDLEQGISETFAGTCGTSGFMDGPKGVNLFNAPGSFGIDDLGNLFVLDANNVYFRLISQDGYVQTLIQGACDQAYNIDPVSLLPNMKSRYVTCYRKWIKTSGLPNQHIFTDLTDLQKCFDNDVQCGDKTRSHPLLYQNSTFRGQTTTR